MDSEAIINVLDQGGPLAIVRYFQWTSFSKSYSQSRYSLLILDPRHRDITEVDIPQEALPRVIPRLEGFQPIHRSAEGTVWERNGFGAKARRLVPRAKRLALIAQKG